MTSFGSRHEAERALAKALSRHIGYTSGAYALSRIVSVVKVFATSPSAYKSEIVDFIRRNSTEDSETSSGAYLSEVLNFTQALGLIETVSSREAKVQRYAATELGRSILGALSCQDEEFYNYFLSKVVAAANADALVPVLQYCGRGGGDSLPEHYLTFQMNLRKLRWEWLQATFPDRSLRDRISERIPWLKSPVTRGADYSADFPTTNTARHHATPLLGWLEELGMVTPKLRTLTQFGGDVLKALVPNRGYFWLGPPRWVFDVLKLDQEARVLGPVEDMLNFETPGPRESEMELKQLAEDVSRMMISAFPYAKLIHAPQASLRLPIEYVAYRAYKDNRCYDWERIVHTVFVENKGRLERLSAHRGQVGFYRYRAHTS